MDAARLAHFLAAYPTISHGSDGMTVITCPARLSFVHFEKPYAKKGSTRDPRYQCVVILPATSNVKPLVDAMGAAWGASPFAKKAPKYNPVKRQADIFAQGYEGFGTEGYFFNCDTKNPPDLFDMAMNPVAASELYSGVWARVKVRASAFDVDGNNGVKFWLQGVQKFADDARFSGGSASDGFTAVGAAPAGNAPASVPSANVFGLPQ